MKKLHLSLRQKIILLYILLGIIPVILAGSLSYFAYFQDIQRNAEITLDYMQMQCADEIHHRLRMYKNAMAGILTDKNVIAAVTQLSQPDADPEATKIILRNRLLSHASTSTDVLSVTYIANSLDYINCSFADSRTQDYYWQDSSVREKFLLPANENFSIDHYVLQRSNAVIPDSYLQDTLYMSFPFSDRVSKQTYGVLVMEIPNRVFLEGMVTDLWGGVDNMMVDREGYILLSLQADYIGRNLNELPYTNPNHYFSRKREIQNSRFVFCSFVSREAVVNQVRQFRTWMVLLIIILCLSFFSAMYIIMRRYTKSIMGIARAIQLYGQGVHEIDLPVKSNDEISIIADRFNQMARENNALLQSLRDRNEHIARVTDLRRKSEIKALQAQINPHFLYNTLDTVNWIAIDNDQQEISVMIRNLGSLLRYSASNIDEQVLLEAELQWCEKYVYLQQKRFDTFFHFHVEADAKARAFPIHKMLLQPPLENCILHGFEGMESRTEMRITLRCILQEDDRLHILLQDNGSGICPKTLEKLRADIDKTALPELSRIGIFNVVSRIRLYYGERGEIDVDSVLGRGTEVRMIIPRENTT